jgi:twitching motility protein PilT
MTSQTATAAPKVPASTASMISMEELLTLLVERGGSDLHLSSGSPPRLRIDGKLHPLEYDPLAPDQTQKLTYSVLTPEQIARFEKNLELDCSFGFAGYGRFRLNVFMQRGSIASVFRLVPLEVRGFEELGLPREVCESLCSLPKGLILVTGATGSGKSTTLAAMIDFVNETYPGHILTIEDPIEFLHRNKRCLVNQREVGGDTKAFGPSLRAALREDPDVVLIGEMRDLETVEAALTISETGHLTFATLHTSDAVQTINRVIDVFPSHQQQQIRTQLSFTLSAVFSQQLVPRAGGRGRALAAEILLVTPAVRALIRESKAHQVYSTIQTGGRLGMKTMNQSLADLYRANVVSYDDALSMAPDPAEFQRLIGK